MRRDIEEQEQIIVFSWIALHEERYPQLKMAYHCPNGGARDARTGAKLKRMGVKKGVPDILCHEISGHFRGFALEMKSGKNKLTKEQKEWLKRFVDLGYYTDTCYSAEEAICAIKEYLKG